MKYTLIIYLLIYCSTFSYSQKSTSVKVIPISDSALRVKFKQSERKYQLVIIYTDWCKPCRALMPEIIKILPSYHDIETYFVNPDPLNHKYIIEKYLAKYPEIKESYILDNTFKGNVKKRFIAFKNKIYPLYPDLIGIPAVLIFDRDCNPIDILIGNDLDKLKILLSKITERGQG